MTELYESFALIILFIEELELNVHPWKSSNTIYNPRRIVYRDLLAIKELEIYFYS